jgi:hypothetical protein
MLRECLSHGLDIQIGRRKHKEQPTRPAEVGTQSLRKETASFPGLHESEFFNGIDPLRSFRLWRRGAGF